MFTLPWTLAEASPRPGVGTGHFEGMVLNLWVPNYAWNLYATHGVENG